MTEGPTKSGASDGLIPKIGAAFGVVGAAFMAYLTKLHFSGDDSALCDLSEALNCSVVNTSVFSDIMGVPVSVLGLTYFLAVIWLFLSSRFSGKRNTLVTAFTVFSLTFGLYLTGIEYFVLGSFCLFCELSKATMVAILAVAIIGAKRAGEKLDAGVFAGGVLVGALFAGGAYLVQRAPIGVPDYSAHAACLTEKNVHMYGAYWCPKCAKQKRLFGDAWQYVSYVECDPRGENAEPQRCIDADIQGTPTWIQEDENGGVVDMWEGVHEVPELLERYDCLDPTATGDEPTGEDPTVPADDAEQAGGTDNADAL